MKITRQLVATLAHDIKGPIGNLAMFTEVLEEIYPDIEKGSVTDSVISNLKIISTKFIDQIDNWSDAFSLTENKLTLNKKLIQIEPLIKEILENNRLFIEKKSLTIIDHIDSGILAEVDREHLRRIIDNLLSIAIMFADAESNILISFYVDPISEKTTCLVGPIDEGESSMFDAYFLNPDSVFDEKYLEKGILKSTGFGLLFSHLSIKAHGFKPVVENRSGKLLIGFTY